MPEYINLNPVIREISDVQNNILLLNGKMDTMGAQVGAVTQDLNTTRQKLQELAEAFEKFSRQAERIAVVQRAETQLGNLKSELDRVYGHYALVRRTSVGVLQAFDVGNVTNDVVAQVSEELMIQSPRYWLAPALVGLAAWSRDDKAICEKSVQEAFTRDAAKTSLFFALILRRVNRHDEAYTWLKHYLMNCDATKLTREFAVILEATARGAFGTQAEQLLTNQLGEWDAELRQNAQLRTAQVTAWVEEIASNREQLVVDDYENLRKLSPDFDRMRSLLESATALGVTAKKYEEIRDRLDAPVGKIEDLLDDLLEKLVTEYDAEELPLRRKAAYAEAVIESNGDLAQAQVKTDKYVRALADTVDAVSLQTQAAITPERLGVSISTQRTAIGNGLTHRRDMSSQIVNAVRVMNGPVVLDHVLRTKPVLDDHQRNLIAVIDLVQREAQAVGINLPTPLRGGQIGIPAASGNIAAAHLLQVIMRPHEIGHVVGEAEEVYRALAQNLLVTRLHLEVDVTLGPQPLDIAWVVASHLHV